MNWRSLSLDLRYSVRRIRRDWKTALSTGLILAVGIGLCLPIFGLVYTISLRSLPFHQPDQLYMLWSVSSFSDTNTHSPVALQRFQSSCRSCSAVSAIRTRSASLAEEGMRRQVQVQEVSKGFFPALGLRMLLGQGFSEGDEGQVAISHGYWRRVLGGDPGVVGRTITLDDRVRTIVGVLPESFVFNSQQTDFWVPLGLSQRDWQNHRNFGIQILVRLRSKTSTDSASNELAAILKDLSQARPSAQFAQQGLRLEPLQAHLVGPIGRRIFPLGGIAALLMTIVAINISAVLLATARDREMESRIRSALGAGQLDLLRQHVIESFLVVGSAALLGLGLAFGMSGLLRSLAPSELPRIAEFQWTWDLVLYGLAITIGCGLLSRLLPALHWSWTSSASPTRQASAVSRAGTRWTNMLIAGEIAFALVLLIASVLITRSYIAAANADLGFEAERLFNYGLQLPERRYPMPDQKRAVMDRIVQEVRGLPSVRGVTVASRAPVYGGSAALVAIERPGNEVLQVPLAQWVVDPEYFGVVGLPILQGGGFEASAGDGSEGSVLVSQSLSRYFDGNPLGESIQWLGRPWRIVGVVGDIKDARDGLAVEGIYFDRRTHPWEAGKILIVAFEHGSGAVAGAIRRIVHEIDPEIAATTSGTVRDLLDEKSKLRNSYTFAIASLGIIGLSLVLTGVLGVILQAVRRRRRELGIRVALGANRPELVLLMARQVAAPILIGLAAGLVIAAAGSVWITSLLFDVQALDLVSWAVAVILLLTVSACSILLPGRALKHISAAELLREAE